MEWNVFKIYKQWTFWYRVSRKDRTEKYILPTLCYADTNLQDIKDYPATGGGIAIGWWDCWIEMSILKVEK